MNAPARQGKRLGRIWWFVFGVGFVILAILVAFRVQYKPFQIVSGSMEPTLLRGDRLFVRMWRSGSHPLPGRGDLVILQSPQAPRVVLFSRVVGLPGDRVEIVAKRLRINGQEVQEPYAAHQDVRTYGPEDGLMASRDNFGPLTVPADHVFVMGDNRDNSYDSRFYGPVPRELLRGGGSAFVYFSLDPRTHRLRGSRTGLRPR